MPNRLKLPAELSSLIEKREQEDRRKQGGDAQSTTEGAASENSAPEVERRIGADRRANDS